MSQESKKILWVEPHLQPPEGPCTVSTVQLIADHHENIERLRVAITGEQFDHIVIGNCRGTGMLFIALAVPEAQRDIVIVLFNDPPTERQLSHYEYLGVTRCWTRQQFKECLWKYLHEAAETHPKVPSDTRPSL